MGWFMHNNLKHHLIRPTNETNHVYVFVSILSGDCLSNLAVVMRLSLTKSKMNQVEFHLK